MPASGKIVESIKSSKEAAFLNHFGHHKCSHEHNKDKESENVHNKPKTGPDPFETDIDTLLNMPLSSRAEIFYDEDAMNIQAGLLNSTTPWKTNPNYFQVAHISSLALLKMSIHARSGGSIEVMGMLTGKIVKQGIVVMDVYPLPVEGTETRVNALSEGYEFMVDYLDSLKKTGRYENIVGWYHSHPGYGCWLSGIDVGTQSLNQRFQDPYLAIVVDPERTIANGKVEIGAFRTYPQEYVDRLNHSTADKDEDSLAPQTIAKNSKDIPAEKVKDFGLHTSHYYSLDVEIFRSSLEECVIKNLWNKYWVSQFVENEQKKEITDDKITTLIQDRLAELNKNIDKLKRSPLSKPVKKNPQQIGSESSKSTFKTITSTNPLSLLTNSQLSPFTRNNFFNGAGQGLGSGSPSPQQPVARDEDSDVGESDSEMNDADGDVDVNDSDSQQGEEDFVGSNLRFNQPQNKGSQGLTNKLRSNLFTSNSRRPVKYRKDTSNQSRIPFSNSLGIFGSEAPSSSGETGQVAGPREEERSLKIAAITSRELINLKLQEILFLNE